MWAAKMAADAENVGDENKPMHTLGLKSVFLEQQKPTQKRVALRNITCKTSNVEIQPAAIKTKLCSFDDNGANIKNSQAVRGKLVNDATASLRAFTIHQDEVPDETAYTSLKVECRQSINSVETDSTEALPHESISFDSSIEVEEFSAESPVALDVSCVNGRMQEHRLADQEMLMISEYSEEIYQYLRKAEKNNRPKPHYLKKQSDITAGMRGILVDWLVEVGEEYKLQTETLFLAVNYIDRFLSHMAVLRGKLQLVGTAAMFIASKFEEIYPPDVSEFVYITDDTYTKKQVLRMEHLILKVLSFDLVVPTALCFLQRYSKLDKLDETTEMLAMYLAELTLLEAEPYLYFDHSIIAAAAVCLANHTMNREPWSPNLVVESGYEMEDISDCVVRLYKTFCGAASCPQQAIREKYKSSKFNDVSSLNPPPGLPS